MTWKELPVRLKIYIILLSLASIPILSTSLDDVLRNNYDPGWIILTILAILTVPPFLVVFRSVSTIALIGDAYVMSIAMLYGCSPCIVATAFHSAMASILARKKEQKHFYRLAFNVSSTVCCAWAYSNLYRFLNPNYSKHIADIALPIVALTITLFVLNSILTAAAICMSSGENIFRFWFKNYFLLGMEFSLSSVSAAIIVALYQVGRWAPIAVAPIIGVLYLWNRVNKAKAEEAENHLKEQEELYLRTVETLAITVEVKDQIAYGHIRRVRVYATELAHRCGIKDMKELEAIRTGALLHDIGKFAIDDYILNKPGRLSKQEFEKIKLHVQAGDWILQQIRFPFPAADYVRCHHERWDGLGYPNGLKGEQIPLGGRILAIADAFDAIRYSRPYKLPINAAEALEILRSQSGTAYDPNLVQLFIDNIDELEKTAAIESAGLPELPFQKSLDAADRTNSDSSSAIKSSIFHNFPGQMIRFAEFCSTAAGQLDLEEFLSIVSRRIGSLIPFSTCAFFLNDGTGYVKAVHVAGCFSETLINYKLALGKGISGWVAAHRKPMINTEADLDFQDLKDRFPLLKYTLAVPILLGEECFGTISLYGENPLSSSQSDLNALLAIAGFIAPPISEIRNRGGNLDDYIDPITQVHQIPHLTTVVPQFLASARDNSSPASLIFLEIKNLHQISRNYGADTENLVLRMIANCIKPELRETDILARFGNQAFLAFLPGVSENQALSCTQRLKQQVKKQSINLGDRSFPIECAAGCSSYPKDGATLFDLLQSAQQSVRARASKSGSDGNKVIGFNPRKH